MKNRCRILFGLAILVLGCGRTNAQSWRAAAKFPGNTRDGAIEFAIGDNIYFGAGEGKDFWQFDTKTNIWKQKANIPGVKVDREFAAAFAIGGKGYVGLGVDSGTILHDMWEYDPQLDKWTRKADYPIAGRDAVLAFSVGDKGYIGGGSDEKFIHSEFYEFDPTSNKWSMIGSLPMGAVAFASAFVVDSKAFVTGGDLGTGNGQLTDLYSFDPATASWELLASFPGAARQAAVSFAIAGKGYLGLGQADYSKVFSDFYSYDPASDKWEKVSADLPIAPGRAWASAVALGGNAYIGGGWDLAANFFNDWWKFDATGSAKVARISETATGTAFPNPVKSLFRLNLATSDISPDFILVNPLGEQVSGLRSISEGLFDASALPSGEYFLHLRHDSSSSVTKIMKE